MAHTVKITRLTDGPRAAYIQVYLKCDGTSGEIADSVLINPADFNIPAKPGLVVEKIWYDVNGFAVRLEFNDLVDNPIWTCSSSNNYVDFEMFGGLPDRSGLDGTGAIQLTTAGFDNAAKQGSLIIKFRKT